MKTHFSCVAFVLYFYVVGTRTCHLVRPIQRIIANDKERKHSEESVRKKKRSSWLEKDNSKVIS